MIYCCQKGFLVVVMLWGGYLINLNKAVMNRTKEIVRSLDIFAHNQFLRYKTQQRYKTVTGGIASITIIIICAAIFLVLILKTFQRSVVISEDFQTFESVPRPFTLEVSPQKKFMMAFGISGLDMRKDVRFFDITFEHYTYNGQTGDSFSYIPLTPCSQSHWTGISSEIDKLFTDFGFEHLYCLPIGTRLTFEGRYSSFIQKYSKIRVSKCSDNNFLFPNSTCASKQELEGYAESNGDFKAMLYYVNTNINSARQKDYISYYLEDKYIFNFNLQSAALSQLYFSEYAVTTDNSILPWQELDSQVGLFVDRINSNPAIERTKVENDYDPYFSIKLSKADFRLDSRRSYQKIQTALSIIGGLFGALQIGLLIFSNFNKNCYEIEFGDRIFRQNNKKSYGSEGFNMIVYLGYKLFKGLLMLGIHLDWKSMKQYLQCQQQTIKQLDINLIFKKLSFFEEAFSVTTQQLHLKGLHLMPKPSISKVKERRRAFIYKSIMYQQLDRKARQIHIEEKEMRRGTLGLASKDLLSSIILSAASKVEERDQQMQNIAHSYKALTQNADKGDIISQKIMKNIWQNWSDGVVLAQDELQVDVAKKESVQSQEVVINFKTIQSSKYLNN